MEVSGGSFHESFHSEEVLEISVEAPDISMEVVEFPIEAFTSMLKGNMEVMIVLKTSVEVVETSAEVVYAPVGVV